MANTCESLTAALSGRYRVERELGAGGMATVYLAHDLRHDRKVALKVLKPELAAVVGAERFLAEIRTTANLQHPHILPLFDSGEVDAFLYFVMPYVEGESLRDRLDREGELPVAEAVGIATAVAGALDYAHRHGVIHRDIKPANILLHDGQPLVADFGIALAVSVAGGGRLTETGLSLGTPYYMSPEQAAGDRELDGRSDVYSLGCVLYEMLAGEPPHSGATAQSILAKILTEEPAPLGQRRRSVPQHVEAAVQAALQKLPADRLGSAQALASALDGTLRLDAPSSGMAQARLPPFRFAISTVLPWTLAAVLGLYALWPATRPSPPGPVRYLNIVLPDSAPLAYVGEAYFSVGQPALALSPDGSGLAYIAQTGASTQLRYRPGDGYEFVTFPGTDSAYAPFFSPDGKWIAFFVGDRLLRISTDGEQLLTIAEANDPYGGAWAEDGRIAVATLDGGRLSVVPAGGGRLELLVEDRNQTFAFPQWLPGDEWLLLQCLAPQPHPCVVSGSTGEVRRLVPDMEAQPVAEASEYMLGSSPRYVEPGYLLFSAIGDNVLMGVRLDARRLAVVGEPVPLIRGVRREGYAGALQVAISRDGDLAYAPGRDGMAARFVWADAGGVLDTLPLELGVYGAFSLSRDGRRLATTLTSPVGTGELWIHDLERGSARRWAGELEGSGGPHWDPSSRWLYAGITDDPVRLVRIDATNPGRVDTVFTGSGSFWFGPMTSDGRYTVSHAAARGARAWYLSVVTEDQLRELPSNPNDESFAVVKSAEVASFAEVSPDLAWMTYTSSEGGPIEVFAVPLATRGPPLKVSRGGGAEATWSPRGDGFFYRSGRSFYWVDRTGNEHDPFAEPKIFVDGDFLDVGGMEYATSPDGKRLLLLKGPSETTTSTLNVITNWHAELERRIGGG